MKNNNPPLAIPDYLQMRELYFKKVEPTRNGGKSIADIGEDIRNAASNGKEGLAYKVDELDDNLEKVWKVFTDAGYRCAITNKLYSSLREGITIAWGRETYHY